MRLRWREFSKGWWPMGPREAMPPGTLRRARGVNAIKTGTLRSRWGTQQLYAFSAHSLYRFRDVRFQGANTILLRDGVSIKTGLNGRRLRFQRMPTTPGREDYLFVAGGGTVFKVAPDGAVSHWGIEAPATDFTVAAGAAGVLTGTYYYAVTFLNATTGSRSNPNPAAFTGPTSVVLAAQQADLSALPVSGDPQVTTVEIWRSFADIAGELFKLDEVANGTTTYTDNTADADLENEVLLFDNIVPSESTSDAFGPHAGRMWTLDDVESRGRVFYSPIGRPEAVEGFLEINNGDDPCLRLQGWGGSLYVFTNGHILQIIGFDTPFTFREVFGAPGIASMTESGSPIDTRFSVVSTPMGIIYHASDGNLRLFDATQSVLAGFEAIARLLQGEALEDVPAFEPVIAESTTREVFFSDATATTLALNMTDASWRVAGGPNTAFYFEPDTQRLVAGEAGVVVIKEQAGLLTDAGTPINFEIETMATLTDAVHEGLVQRVYFDVNTQDQLLTPTLVLDNDEIVLPPFRTASRPAQSVEIVVGRWGRVIGVRLAGSLTAQVEVFGIEADVYVPVTEGAAP